MIKTVLCAAVLSLCTAGVAAADNFRCPNGAIVSTGDTQSIVAIKCDPPTAKVSRMESEAGRRGATILMTVEEWTYNEGPDRLVHILVFRNGILTQVQTGGYGK
ncbi:DUF2845 domain-containing protein [Trichlorobacter ammonificans]|uniref:DUF2845 domain-containing protein n=1 Tax=Trichlorobacter ammonificans TaxID=2916410 RepID=A0ABM9D6W8_9BACT|nr:DUF2845 domain-containing protein [Trichlorobacter ammonificans]CAH2030134.1 conserved exported protein of unknown function [Trichlorobacter ammonificans]